MNKDNNKLEKNIAVFLRIRRIMEIQKYKKFQN